MREQWLLLVEVDPGERTSYNVGESLREPKIFYNDHTPDGLGVEVIRAINLDASEAVVLIPSKHPQYGTEVRAPYGDGRL